MARWNKRFAQSTALENRPLPASVYAGTKIPKEGLTLKAVRKEMKALIDLMDKRFKAAKKKGIEYESIKQYERHYWDKPSTVRTVEEGVRQIRSMWKVVSGTKTPQQLFVAQQNQWKMEYQTLLQRGWFTEENFTYEDFLQFRKFFAVYADANKEAQYYYILQDIIDISQEGTTSVKRKFAKSDWEDLMKRWDYWERQAEKARARYKERLKAGEFVNGATVRAIFEKAKREGKI